MIIIYSYHVIELPLYIQYHKYHGLPSVHDWANLLVEFSNHWHISFKKNNISFSFQKWRILTDEGFFVSIIPSLLGLVILGRRLSGLVKVEPLTAIIKKKEF